MLTFDSFAQGLLDADDGIDSVSAPPRRPPEARVAVDRPAPSPGIERHAYQAPGSRRLFAIGGTGVVTALIFGCAFFTLGSERHRIRPAPLIVTLVALAPPAPDVPHAKADPAKPQPERQSPATPAAPPVLAAPSPVPMPIAVAPPVIAAPSPAPATIAPAAPPALPASPHVEANSAPSHGPDRWEGRLLARIERFRHYPADAQRARQQGTALIRFRMNREGHVLSAQLDRSSGSAALDEAAVATVRSADPLPKIPADRPDTVELVVPIAFTLAH